MRLSPFPICIAAYAWLALSSVTAQDSDKPAKPQRQARFLAVGDSPPYAQEIRDGVSYELEPPAGSIPPREVISSASGEGASPVSLRLGSISSPVKAPPGVGPFDLRKVGEDQKSAPWLRLNRPELGNFLVILFRQSGKGVWNEPAHLVLPEGTVDSVRVVNLLPVAARIVWGDQPAVLAPGKILERRIQVGSDTPFQIFSVDATGASKRYYSGNVTQNEGERGLVVIYRADGTSPRRPVKIAMLREPLVPGTKPSGEVNLPPISLPPPQP